MGASFARTDAQKKQHKERSQPFNRQRYGLLEKKKDYVLRAKDYAEKQARLKTLRNKASNKNEDEFYFGMINKTTKKGVEVKSRGNEALDQSVTKVLKTQDIGYIKTMAAIESKKIQALQAAQHVNQAAAGGNFSTLPMPNDKKRFVETTLEMEEFDPEAEAAEKKMIRSTDPADRLLRRQMRAEKAKSGRELQSRLDRLEKLRIAERESTVHRQLQTKGSRKKVGVDTDGVARYKWKQERKR